MFFSLVKHFDKGDKRERVSNYRKRDGMGKNSELIKTTKEFSEFSQKCKQMALERRARSPVQVEKTLQVLENIQEYIDGQRVKGKPLTHAGFMRCFGVDKDIYYSLDKYDYTIEEFKVLHNLPADATEYITDENDVIPLVSWCDIKKNVCDVAIQEQLEENCYTNRGNPAGSIFGLKARYNWREDNTQGGTVNNNLVIADSEQARKVLSMLTE